MGRQRCLIRAAVSQTSTVDLIRAYPDLLDVFFATPYHVMVRFGMWEQLLREPEPAKHPRRPPRPVGL